MKFLDSKMNNAIIQKETKLKIYLASPYSHPDPGIRGDRFRKVCKKMGELVAKGYIVYCPIAMSHPVVENSPGLGSDFETWRETDEAFLQVCDELWVYNLPGWSESVGVKAEMEFAAKYGITVRLLNESADILPLSSDINTILPTDISVGKQVDASTFSLVSKWPIEFFDLNLPLLDGEKKYGMWNFLKPEAKRMEWKEVHDCAFHHLARSFAVGPNGNRADLDSGIDHALPAAINMLMVYTRLKRGFYK